MNVAKMFKLSAIAAVLVCTATVAFAAESEFSYSGYLRVGYSYMNGMYGYDGGFGLTSKAYGAQKWDGRLGKEANQQYMENTFINTWTAEGGAWAKMFCTITLESMNPGGDADDCAIGESNVFWGSSNWEAGTVDDRFEHNPNLGTSTNFRMRNRQAYVEMGGLGFSPDTSFWVGRRFYNREDIHVQDWYLLDFSGDGAGVSNIAGLGINLGVITQQTNAQPVQTGWGAGEYTPTPSASKGEGVSTATTFVGKFENSFVRVDGSLIYRPHSKAGSYSNGSTQGYISAANGQLISVKYKPNKFFFFADGNSGIYLQYAKGASAENIWWGDRFTHIQSQGCATDKKAYSYNIVAAGLAQLTDQFSLPVSVGYTVLHSTKGRVGGSGTGEGDVSRAFFVARPHYNFTTNVAAEVELGYFTLNRDGDGGAADAGWYGKTGGIGLTSGQKNNWTAKITPAAVLTLDNNFYTRPALRLYGSYEMVGKKVSSTSVAYNEEKSNLSYGFQVEAWW